MGGGGRQSVLGVEALSGAVDPCKEMTLLAWICTLCKILHSNEITHTIHVTILACNYMSQFTQT